MCSFKDNPVPSLDKLKCPRILLRLECEKCGYSASEALYTNDDKYCHGVNPKDIICKHDLQNGVETDKEQPIKDKCSCKNPHYGFKTIAICTDCNGIKDNEYWKNLEKKCSCMDYPCDECDNG